MYANYSNIRTSIERAASAHQGQLSRPDLIRIGKEVSTTKEKIVQFFKGFVRIVRDGTKIAAEKKENFYINKSVSVITDINLKKLVEKITSVNQMEKMAYLSSLKPGEVLVEQSHHWKAIQSWHQGYRIIQQARANPDLHWLKSFATKDDLGEKLELFDLFTGVGKVQLEHIVELELLQQKDSGTYFIPLLQFILGGNKLRNLTQDQMDDFKSCLALYRQLPKQLGEDKLKPAMKVFSALKEIEKERGKQAKEDFQAFLATRADMQELIARLPPASVEKMLKLQGLVPQLIGLPVDLYFSSNIDEAIAKMEEELPENLSKTFVKRYGDKFPAIYESFPEKFFLSPQIVQLQKIEEDYRLCGKSEQFAQLMNKMVGKGSYQPKEFRQLIEEIFSKNELPFYLMTQLGEHTRKLMTLKIPPNDIRGYQQEVGDKVGPMTTELLTQLLGGKKALEEKLLDVKAAFNKGQLEQAKQAWRKYGSEVADHLASRLGPEVEQGKIHYKEKDYEQQLASLSEIDKTAAACNADYLTSEYGPALASHFIVFLLSPAGKELTKQNPEFLTTEWPSLLKKLQGVKMHFLSQGVTPEQFKDALRDFLSKALYAQTQLIQAESLDEFSRFLQYKLNEQQLQEMSQTYGSLFMDSMNDYLKENEPDALLGNLPLEETLAFQATSFQDQVRLFLKPYILKNLRPLGVLDEHFAATALFAEPLTPQSLQIRLDNLNWLKELGKEGATPRERLLIKEFISTLIPPYLINLNDDYRVALKNPKEMEIIEKERKSVREAVSKLVKFCCKEIDKDQIYSPNLLARATSQLLGRERKPSDAPLKTLHDAAEKCTAFFNRSVSEEFQTICFRLYVEDAARAVCEKEAQPYQGKISDFIEGLIARFSKQDKGLHSSHAAAYVSDMASFAATLALSAPEKNFMILDLLVQEATSKNIFFDVKKIHEKAEEAHAPLTMPKIIKEKLMQQVKSTSGTSSESVGILRTIEKNPFAVVSAFFPRFIENLLTDEDKHKVQDIRQGLIPLGPLFNQSSLVGKGVSYLSKITALIPESTDPDSAKKFLVTKINSFNSFDIGAMAKLNGRQKYIQALNKEDLGLAMTVTEFIADKLLIAHHKLNSSESSKVVDKTGSAPSKEPEKDAVVEFIRTTLPQLVEDRKSLNNWIKRLPVILPIIRRIGGGWFANQILKRYVSAKLEKIETLDKPTKKLVNASLESIIQTVLLASPALLEKHNIDRYFDFLERLNGLMKQKDDVDSNALFIEVMTIIQQLTRELAAYGPPLEDAMAYTVEQTTVPAS